MVAWPERALRAPQLRKRPVLTGTWRADRSDRARFSHGRLALLGGVLWAIVAAGCGGGATQQEVDHSMREFQLAATLRDEGNTAAAVEHLRKSLDLYPDNANAHALLGFILMEKHDFHTAVDHLREAESLLAEDERVGSGRTVAEVRNWLGIALTELHRYDDAIEVLRESASDVTNAAPHLAWGNLGQAYFDKGEYAQALEALEQAVKLQPRFCVGYYRVGQVYFAQKKLKPAEEALTHALEADDLCAERFQAAYRLRGEVRARLGDRDAAVHDLERCVEIAPKTDDAAACRRLLRAN